MASLEHQADRGFATGYIDTYESGIRVVSDLLRSLARAVDVEPVRTIGVAAAELTRDIGAAQISGARWLLDA